MNSADNFSKQEIEDIVAMVRLELYNRGLPCGPEKIKKKMEENYNILPMPSETTISRILSRKCLTHQRTGWYAEDYPQLTSRCLRDEG